MFSRSRKGVGIHISENEEGEKFSGDGYFMYGNCIVNNNKSNLHVRPPLVSDLLAKTPNFPSLSLTVGTSRKRPPPVSDRDH